jgi:hypothetical protein
MKRGELFQNMSVSILSLAIFFILGEVIVRLTIGATLVTETDDVLFWKYKKNQTGHQKLYSPVATIDRYGFRYSGKDLDFSLPSIYVGGDSYGFGDGALDNETFAARLQKIMDSRGMDYNVLNAGVCAYGTEQILNRIEMEAEKHNSRYVVLLWSEEDINRLRDISPEQKRKFLRDYNLRSMFRYSVFLKLVKEQVFDKFLQREFGFGSYRDRNIAYANAHSFSEKAEGLTPKIKASVKFLKDRNIIPIWVFVTVPSTREFKDYIISLSEELSVKLIDPEPLYRKEYPGLENMATKRSGHFKPEVYKLLAGQVFREVFERGER